VLSLDSDSQLVMHQKPFLGKAPSGPAGELTALPDPLAGLERSPSDRGAERKREGRTEKGHKKGRKGKKRE